MFREAVLFDQPLGGWKVGRRANVARMFLAALSYNQDMNSWECSRKRKDDFLTGAVNFRKENFA
jgi:hypothetical protein